MRILWVKSDLLHPTTRGGQIRTLEVLRRLAQRHEIHYVGLEDPAQPEGVARSSEYCARCYPVRMRVPPRRSAAFAAQLARGLVSRVPVAIRRYYSPRMRETIGALVTRQRFDHMVCDFLVPAPAIPDLAPWILFQHNVETCLWQRLADQAPDPLRRAYLRLQAARMRAFEARVCRAVAHVIAISAADAALMRSLFGVVRVSTVPTGVDVEHFARPLSVTPVADLVFVGSMDWLPNIHGIRYFVNDVLPLIRRRRPRCTLAVVGRTPPSDIQALPRTDPQIVVTGTVPDVRPYLWGSTVSIVPLYIGGGTRLKIYEAMAAGTAVVSTTLGAEGLDVDPGRHIHLADTPEAFADCCTQLLDDSAARSRCVRAALELVSSRYSWDRVTDRFEEVLEQVPRNSGVI